MDVKRKKRNKNKKIAIVVALSLIVAALIFLLALVLSHKNETKTGNDSTTETPSSGKPAESTPAETESETRTEEPTTEYEVTIADVVVKSTDTSVDLSGKTFESLDVLKTGLSMLPSLTYVDLCDSNLSNEQMEILMTEFPHIKFVWKIEIKEHGTIRTDAVAFSTLNNGTTTYRLTNEDAQVFKYCTEMRILDLGHNAITDFSFLKNMPELRILIAVDDLNPEDDAHYRITDISGIQYCTKLSYLELFLNEISDISALQNLNNLVDVNICHNNISNVDALMNMPKLERLYIKYNPISQEDINRLVARYPDAKIVYTGDFESTGDAWRFDANEVKHERYALMREIIEEVHGLAQCDKPDDGTKDILEKHDFYSVFG